jgi:hypothetical protein
MVFCGNCDKCGSTSNLSEKGLRGAGSCEGGILLI